MRKSTLGILLILAALAGAQFAIAYMIFMRHSSGGPASLPLWVAYVHLVVGVIVSVVLAMEAIRFHRAHAPRPEVVAPQPDDEPKALIDLVATVAPATPAQRSSDRPLRTIP